MSTEGKRMAAPISPPSKPWEGFCARASRRDFAAQFVRDMDADDLVERRLRLKAERQRAAGIEPARPAGDDPRHQRVRLAADAGGDFVSGDTAQRGDLLGNRAAHAGHGEIDAGPELFAVD